MKMESVPSLNLQALGGFLPSEPVLETKDEPSSDLQDPAIVLGLPGHLNMGEMVHHKQHP